MNKEEMIAFLNEEISQIQAEREKSIANVNACEGAMAMARSILARLNASKPEITKPELKIVK